MKLLKSIRNCASSISFIVVLLLTITIGILIATSFYWIFSESVLSSENQDIKTRKNINEICTKFSTFVSHIENGQNSIEGSCRTVGELLYKTDYKSTHQRVKILFEYYRSLSAELDTTDITTGWWFYTINQPNYNNSIYQFSASFTQLKTGEGNNTVYNGLWKVHDSPIPDEEDIVDPLLELVSNTTMFMSDSSIVYYATPHWEWDYWMGSVGGVYTPFFSFSIVRELKNLAGRDRSCNVWFGCPTADFSEYLRDLSPPNSYTWIIELGRDFLLGSSDAVSMDVLVNDKGGFKSPREYTHNKVIQAISKTILDDKKILDSILRKKSIKLLFLNNHNVYAKYINSSQYNGEWLVINSKQTILFYQDTIIKTAISVSVSLLVVLFLVIFWVIFSVILSKSITSLKKSLDEVKKMNLEDIKFSKWTDVFGEFHIINKRLKFMVDKLIEFKSFLPSHLKPNRVSNLSEISLELDTDIKKSMESLDLVESESESELSVDDSSSMSRRTEKSDFRKHQEKFTLGLFEEHAVVVIKIFFELPDKMTLTENFEKKDHITFFGNLIETIKRYKGHIVNFSHENITVIFHGIDYRKPIHLIDFIKQKSDMTSEAIYFTTFMSKGDITCGNVGCITQRTFAYSGEPFEKIEKMEQTIGKRTDLFCIVDDDIYQSVQSAKKGEYKWREIPLWKDVEFSCYELGRRTFVKNDEWMYELKEKEEIDKWELYNKAVSLFKSGRKIDSIKKMKLHLKDYPHDKLGLQWLEIMKNE